MPVPDVLPLLPTDLPLNDQPPHAAAGPELLHILHQDDDMVVVYKPAGWLVHRTGLDAGETRFVMQALRDQMYPQGWKYDRLECSRLNYYGWIYEAKLTTVPLHQALYESMDRSGSADAKRFMHKSYLCRLDEHMQPDQAACA